MIHTYEAWDAQMIHEIQEQRGEILAIPHKTHALKTKTIQRQLCHHVWNRAKSDWEMNSIGWYPLMGCDDPRMPGRPIWHGNLLLW